MLTVVYVETVVTPKQQAEGRHQGSDVVIDNPLVDAQHECPSSKAGEKIKNTNSKTNK